MIKELFYKAKELFTGKKEIRCKRCGRVLKTARSKEMGVGVCCFKKMMRDKYRRVLFVPKNVEKNS